MRIMEVKVYEFRELSDKAKERVLDKLWDINVDYDWWEWTYEDAENIGLIITEFDLGGSSYVKGKFLVNAEDTAHMILSDHGEHCPTVQTAKDYLIELKRITDDYEKVHPNEVYPFDYLDTEEIDREFLKSLCEDYRIMLQQTYDYLISEEGIIETIEANEYEFTETGKLI